MKISTIISQSIYGTIGYISSQDDLNLLEQYILYNLPVLKEYKQIIVATNYKNYPEFVDHRHDQSIYSVNVKKNKLITFRAPSQYGNGFEGLYRYSNYPQIINHHRNQS